MNGLLKDWRHRWKKGINVEVNLRVELPNGLHSSLGDPSLSQATYHLWNLTVEQRRGCYDDIVVQLSLTPYSSL